MYIDHELEYFLFNDGRAVKQPDGSFQYEYFLKDHLGTVRVIFGDRDDDGEAEILQERHFYPYGMQMGEMSYISSLDNKYLFQGKEQLDAHKLFWYDYGARFYDPQIGRWHSMDPLMEKYYSISPYTFCANNPILFIDPSGMNMHYNWELGIYEDDEGNEVSWNQVQQEYGIGNVDPSNIDNSTNSNNEALTNIKDYLSNLWHSFIAQFSLTDNKDALYQNYANGDPSAIKEVQNREIINTIANTEITPSKYMTKIYNTQ